MADVSDSPIAELTAAREWMSCERRRLRDITNSVGDGSESDGYLSQDSMIGLSGDEGG